MNANTFLVPDPRTIILSTSIGVLSAFLLMWLFFRLKLKGSWDAAGPMRKRVLSVSLMVYVVFLTAFSPVISLKMRAGESMAGIFYVMVFFNVFAAVLLVELLRAVLKSGETWTNKRHMVYIVAVWTVSSVLTAVALLMR